MKNTLIQNIWPIFRILKARTHKLGSDLWSLIDCDFILTMICIILISSLYLIGLYFCLPIEVIFFKSANVLLINWMTIVYLPIVLSIVFVGIAIYKGVVNRIRPCIDVICNFLVVWFLVSQLGVAYQRNDGFWFKLINGNNSINSIENGSGILGIAFIVFLIRLLIDLSQNYHIPRFKMMK